MGRTHLRGWDYVTTPFTLDDGDSLLLDPGITLEMLQRVPAVTFTGGRALLRNEGEITTYGEHCIAGTLTGPFDIRIVNALSFRSKSSTPGADIVLDSAEGTSGTLRIVNSGGSLGPSDPAGIHGGIDLAGLHADHVTLVNTGKIAVRDFGSTVYAGSFGADRIVNTGSMWGKVLLGAGDDRLRNTGEFFGAIYGGDGDDRIMGGANNDPIWGGTGRDIMAGGLGGDYYLFNSIADSAPDRAHADVIRGFDKATGDVVGLGLLDADTTVEGDQAFTFLGDAAFSGVAGELICRITHQGAVLYADVDGDAQSDFALVVQGAITQASDLQLVL
jgi:Ca2+-binding RTX toxin-like protein